MGEAGVALVTGGARRIGRAISLALAGAGYAVAIHYRSSQGEAEDLASRIRAGGGKAATVRADLATQTPESLVSAAAAALGPVTLLVNNASAFAVDTFGGLTQDGLAQALQVNLSAPVLLAQAFAAGLPADAEGCIVNLIDQRVWKLTPQLFSYTLAKSALWTATRTMAQALAPRIRVNGVGPGPVLPNPLDGDHGFAQEVAGLPLRQQVEPEEIAEAVLFLARARKVTGQMIAVDAGQHIGWRTPDIVG